MLPGFMCYPVRISIWNALPQQLVDADSLEAFKTVLNQRLQQRIESLVFIQFLTEPTNARFLTC